MYKNWLINITFWDVIQYYMASADYIEWHCVLFMLIQKKKNDMLMNYDCIMFGFTIFGCLSVLFHLSSVLIIV